MNFKNHEKNDFGHGLDLLFILHQMHALSPMRSVYLNLNFPRPKFPQICLKNVTLISMIVTKVLIYLFFTNSTVKMFVG